MNTQFLSLRSFWSRSIAVCAIGSMACSCVGAPGAGGNAWAIDNVTSQCVASVLGGALVGGLIGAAAGHGRGGAIGTGAAIGLAAGGAMCAVMVQLDEQDRARIRAAQLAAARTGQLASLNYRGSDGLNRSITVRPGQEVYLPTPVTMEPVPNPTTPPARAPSTTPAPDMAMGSASRSAAEIAAASGKRICRQVETNVSVQSKGDTAAPAQTICRTPSGDWEPAQA